MDVSSTSNDEENQYDLNRASSTSSSPPFYQRQQRPVFGRVDLEARREMEARLNIAEDMTMEERYRREIEFYRRLNNTTFAARRPRPEQNQDDDDSDSEQSEDINVGEIEADAANGDASNSSADRRSVEQNMNGQIAEGRFEAQRRNKNRPNIEPYWNSYLRHHAQNQAQQNLNRQMQEVQIPPYNYNYNRLHLTYPNHPCPYCQRSLVPVYESSLRTPTPIYQIPVLIQPIRVELIDRIFVYHEIIEPQLCYLGDYFAYISYE